MAVYKRLKDFLNRNKIKYTTKRHKEVFTAQEVAAAQHIPGDALAKVVMINADGKMGMLMLPASRKVDFKKLSSVLGTKKIKLATEKEFKSSFPDCEVGAMPPFGSFYNMPVLADKSFIKCEKIGFRAGSHKDIVVMGLRDFDKLEKPIVSDISIHI